MPTKMHSVLMLTKVTSIIITITSFIISKIITTIIITTIKRNKAMLEQCRREAGTVQQTIRHMSSPPFYLSIFSLSSLMCNTLCHRSDLAPGHP